MGANRVTVGITGAVGGIIVTADSEIYDHSPQNSAVAVTGHCAWSTPPLTETEDPMVNKVPAPVEIEIVDAVSHAHVATLLLTNDSRLSQGNPVAVLPFLFVSESK